MKKINCVISAPIDTYSGYGGRSRDFVKALIKNKPDWDVKILSQRWGNTRKGWLADHSDTVLTPLLAQQFNIKPDVWIQITVPNEFQPVGTFNIGVTAGIETTLCHNTWLEGCNRMNLVLTSSEHSKNVFEKTIYTIQNNNQPAGTLKLQRPVEVLFEGVDLDAYKPLPKSSFDLDSIPEQFCYLTVGHWMQGHLGHDRKNIGYTVKAFLETFKNREKQPALLLKVQTATSSIIDRDIILSRIDQIRRTVKGKLPSVYLLHGDLTDENMNELYNHPKVKALVSLTKGEGFGRPLIEFAAIGKPVIASKWSGHLDFLKDEYTSLVPGSLEKVHPSAVTKDMILPEAEWFKPNDERVAETFRDVFKLYKTRTGPAKKQKEYIESTYTLEHMERLLDAILSRHLPEFPKVVELDLKQLKLPKLAKK